MTDTRGMKMKRRGGRWVTTDDYRETGGAWKKVVGRVWYLLIPLVGVLFAQDAYVRPVLMKNENRINRSITATAAVEDSLAGEVRKQETEKINIDSDISDMYEPQIELYGTVLDSLRQERSLYDASLPDLRERAESLRVVQSGLQQTLNDVAVSIQERQATTESLKSRRATLRDSIQVVSQDLVALSDTYDRLANPDKYRKNSALVPGPGNFPDRDKLPRR